MPPAQENVENLADWLPGSRKIEVSLSFSGEAGKNISQLMSNLKAKTPNEVVLRAIALLLATQGKEIVLRNPDTGAEEAVVV